MKFLIIQKHEHDDRYEDVAKVTRAEDAIHFAASLAARVPTRYVHVYRLHRGEYAYSLGCFCGKDDSTVPKALADHASKEKEWRRDMRTKAAASETRKAFRLRFAWQDMGRLDEDAAFRKLHYGAPPRLDEAEARAAELGIFPTSALVATP